ncbi:hypothetical protein [Actinophytocola sp. NPDC049390]|uniref:hypothetical protein n=1 Tax=Actinophytocola sp. NPDC049390 TaxID=3363894 RepID=UPI00378DA5B3
MDELIELSTRPTSEVFTALSRITATASGDGIAATVNLEGRLIALDLAPHALAAGPEPLAAEIFRLVQEASAAALNAGIEVLAPAAGEDVAAELRALVLPEPTPPRPMPEVTDDFSQIETWAVPR